MNGREGERERVRERDRYAWSGESPILRVKMYLRK